MFFFVNLFKLANKMPGCYCIDFEKAFDSLSWNFLFWTSEKFNFRGSFIKWVRIFYTNISSYVTSNGVETSLFLIGIGVRQESPYLFQLTLETLLPSTVEPLLSGHLLSGQLSKSRIYCQYNTVNKPLLRDHPYK